jgi:cytoskeleton protein RodZ
MAEIGATLREARMRERIDVSEIEATTKIRAKYLRALENEEWDLLPGPTFVKSFLRTYADTLGLDGKALVEEYRLQYEHPSEPLEPIVSTPNRGPRTPPRQGAIGGGGGGPSRGYMVLAGIVGIVIVLLIVGLVSGGGGGSNDTQGTDAGTTAKGTHSRSGEGGARARTGVRTGPRDRATGDVSLTLRATGTVYVCLIGEAGHKLIAGKTLESGERTPTFTAKRFELTLGNDSVALTIDGIPRVIPPSSQAIGYEITKAGRRTLAPGQQPTCT